MRTASPMLVVAVTLALHGCGSSAKTATSSQPTQASVVVRSDFAPGALIPRVHTCEGRDLSPPLRASGLPGAANELLVVMRDHDAPGGDFIHWAIARVEPMSGSMHLPASARPPGAVLGRNSFGSVGYRGPCPPRGDPPHHYEITVYALAKPSMLTAGFSAGAVATLSVLATARITGVYARR